MKPAPRWIIPLESGQVAPGRPYIEVTITDTLEVTIERYQDGNPVPLCPLPSLAAVQLAPMLELSAAWIGREYNRRRERGKPEAPRMTLEEIVAHSEAQRPCRNLSAFLDDELDQPSAAAFTEHLPTCAACRAAVDEGHKLEARLTSIARIEGALTTLGSDENPPPHWQERVIAATKLCALLVRFTDGELDEKQAAAFRMHLAVCDSCQSMLGEVMQLRARLSTLMPRSK